MRIKGYDNFKKKMYNLYTKDTEELMMTGTSGQLAEYCNRTKNCIVKAARDNRVVAKKYRVYDLGFKDTIYPQTRICSCCGKEKPLDSFLKSGNHYYTKCVLCRMKGN